MAKSRSNKGRWWVGQRRPDFKAGDFVKPNGNYRYSGNHYWPDDEWRRVDALTVSPASNGYEYYTLRVWNPNTQTFSYYNPANFVSDEQYEADRLKDYGLKMARMAMHRASIDALTGENNVANAYERTKYFAIRVENGAEINANGGFAILEASTRSIDIDTTPLRDRKSETIEDVKGMITEGDKYIVCQTVCLVEAAPPRPPIIVTEYK